MVSSFPPPPGSCMWLPDTSEWICSSPALADAHMNTMNCPLSSLLPSSALSASLSTCKRSFYVVETCAPWRAMWVSSKNRKETLAAPELTLRRWSKQKLRDPLASPRPQAHSAFPYSRFPCRRVLRGDREYHSQINEPTLLQFPQTQGITSHNTLALTREYVDYSCPNLKKKFKTI